MTDGSRQTFQDVARELTAGWASMYPAALSSGVSYWAEVAAVASSYYGDVMQGLIAVVQNPSASDAILTDLVTRFKGYLAQSGDLAERTLLDFNRRLETTARPSPPAASPIAAARVSRRAVPAAARRGPGNEGSLEGRIVHDDRSSRRHAGARAVARRAQTSAGAVSRRGVGVDERLSEGTGWPPSSPRRRQSAIGSPGPTERPDGSCDGGAHPKLPVGFECPVAVLLGRRRISHSRE